MRRNKRTRSVLAILSFVMAVTVLLGGFMAFADHSTDDWGERDRDLVRAAAGSLGASGQRIGYSEPPLGYSMTVTYEAQADDPQLGSSGVSATVETVTVQDGDEVPANTELSIAVDVDIDEAEIGIFSVLVNDVALTNEITDILEFKFRSKHTVTEDSVIVIEPTVLTIAPMSFSGTTITINGSSANLSSTVSRGWGNPMWNGVDYTWTYSWSCTCGAGNNNYTTGTSASNTTPPTAPSFPNSTHYQYHCDRTRYNASAGDRTIVINLDPNDAAISAATSTWWTDLVSAAAHESRNIAINIANGVTATTTATVSGTSAN